ncbi:MAG: hypothetical protein HYX34_15320 [Actinobacteria bacterium]|nr:hypothetical protein [Actinomycetota bacterium]
MSLPALDEFNLAEAIGVVRRHLTVIALSIVVGAVLAVGFTVTRPVRYASTAIVEVSSTAVDASTRANQRIDLNTEVAAVTSDAVVTQASRALGTGASARSLRNQVSARIPGEAQVLAITFTAGTATAAQAGAQAFAEGYVADTATRSEPAQRRQLKAIDSQIAALQTQSDTMQARLAKLDRTSAEFAALNNLLLQYANQMFQLRNTREQAAATTAIGARILRGAPRPGAPLPRHAARNLVAGLVAGALAGVALAFLRHKSDDTVHDVRRLAVLADVPVLGTAPALGPVAGQGPQALAPASEAGQDWRRIRRQVLNQLTDGGGLVVVTGARRGAGTSVAAAFLADALARSGRPVVLVDTDVATARAASLTGAPPRPGLAEIVRRDVPAEAALHQVAPCLRVLPMGLAQSDASDLLALPDTRSFLSWLRDGGYDKGPARPPNADKRYLVVVDAPPVLDSAATLDLTDLADLVVLVAPMGRMTGEQLADAIEVISGPGAPRAALLARAPDRRRLVPEAIRPGRRARRAGRSAATATPATAAELESDGSAPPEPVPGGRL